jgi:hypothetical protein
MAWLEGRPTTQPARPEKDRLGSQRDLPRSRRHSLGKLRPSSSIGDDERLETTLRRSEDDVGEARFPEAVRSVLLRNGDETADDAGESAAAETIAAAAAFASAWARAPLLIAGSGIIMASSDTGLIMISSDVRVSAVSLARKGRS